MHTILWQKSDNGKTETENLIFETQAATMQIQQKIAETGLQKY